MAHKILVNSLENLDNDFFIDLEKLSQKIGLTKKAILNRSERGSFPRPAYTQVKAYWLIDEVNLWLAERTNRNATQGGK